MSNNQVARNKDCVYITLLNMIQSANLASRYNNLAQLEAFSIKARAINLNRLKMLNKHFPLIYLLELRRFIQIILA